MVVLHIYLRHSFQGLNAIQNTESQLIIHTAVSAAQRMPCNNLYLPWLLQTWFEHVSLAAF